MQPYANLSGKSGVTGFDIGDDRIAVSFRIDKRLPTFTSRSIVW